MNLPTCPDGNVTRLAVARAARGLTCAQLGEAVGVSASQISAWERGLSDPVGAQRAALALRLGWPVCDFGAEPLPEKVGWLLAVKARNRSVLGLRPRQV